MKLASRSGGRRKLSVLTLSLHPNERSFKGPAVPIPTAGPLCCSGPSRPLGAPSLRPRKRLGLLQRRFAREHFRPQPPAHHIIPGPDVGLANMLAMFEDAPPPVARWVHRTLAAHPASLDVLPTDLCLQSYTCAAAIFLEERAIWRVLLASKEAPRIEPLNHYHFDEVILNRGCTWT